ncbi:ribonuclease E/G-like protein, chloroplastic isoform X1 [Coffea arabica]|uniref:Ribonuclease E/G-like protein, chloroplastic isoform X1 n=2 Tax=Coffea arabica TaxID=13443 RepID=A0ABM4V283_COFAR
MVILLSSADCSGLYSTRKQIPRVGNSTCNCLMKGEMWTSCDILWKPQLIFSISLYSSNKRIRKVLVENSLARCHSRKPQAHVIRSSVMESWLPLCLPTRDKCNTMKCLRSDSSVSHQELQDHKFFCKAIKTISRKSPDFREKFSVDYEFLEEPWLSSQLSYPFVDSDASGVPRSESEIRQDLNCETIGSELLSQSTKKNFYPNAEGTVSPANESFNANGTFYEVDQPIEEPWLLQTFHSCSSDVKTVSNFPENEECSEDRETPPCIVDEHGQTPEKLLADDEDPVISEEDSVTTMILINSSICTMQRIAVLENGKLVELLLEPVKNNVQCDSVYLGVVTKLVPHMGGAFVNIGGPRPSLMDIKPKREPFIFPPFCHQRKDKNVNGSVVARLGENAGVPDNKTISDEIEEIDFVGDDESEVDSEEFMDDDIGEHENDEGGEILQVLKENCNGCAGDAFEFNSERYLEKLSGNGYQTPGATIDQKADHCKVESPDGTKWTQVQKGTKIIVQVVKEGLGTKGPTLTAYPKLRSRFWILIARCNTIGISKKISGVERTRLRVMAKTLQPPGFGLTVRTVAAGHSLEELQKDLESLLSTWKSIVEHAKSAALAADEGVDGAVPILLHQAMGQTLSVVQDYFSEKVESMIVDSPRTYHEVTNYLQEIAPNLCDRVELYSKSSPLFDEYKLEEEIDNILSKRVPLDNGGYLVIEQTEALVSIDVNGGHCMLGHGTSQEKAILDVNLAAAKQIARELRLRDIGGIIVVDFIDMQDDSNKRLVYEEVKKAVERDRSRVKVSELSRHGLMEITRKRVRPSVTFMISEPCTCCCGTGRVEALETSFSKVEREICRLLSMMELKADPEKPNSWPRFILRVDRYMCNYLTSGKRTKLAVLSSSLKVWILLKVVRGLARGSFELKHLTDDKEYQKQHQAPISMLRPAEIGSRSPTKTVTLFPKKWKTGGK